MDMTEKKPTDWLTVREAADFAGYTAGYVRQLIAEDKVRAQRIGGKQWLISPEEAERLRKRRQRLKR